jgi:hypothetical protein
VVIKGKVIISRNIVWVLVVKSLLFYSCVGISGKLLISFTVVWVLAVKCLLFAPLWVY